jgi:hypothetical protein
LNRQLYAVPLFVAALAAAPALGQLAPMLGPRIVVQETPNFLNSPPEVAFSPAGSYLAVWSDLDANRHFQIFGRLFDAAGALSGATFQITPAGFFPGAPRVAANGAGFAVVWTEEGVFLRRYDAHGTPLGAAIQVDSPEITANCDVALNAAGDALVVWTTNEPQAFVGYRVFARIVSHDGTLSAIKPLTPDRFTIPTVVRAAAAPDGSFLALWQQIADAVPTTLQAQKVDAAGNWAPPFQVNEAAYPSELDSRPLFRQDGSFAILWKSLFFLPSEPTMVREFDAAGTPRTHEISLVAPPMESFDAALDPGGNTLVFTADSGLGAQGFLFDRSWNLVTSLTFLARDDAGFQTQPSLAADSGGAFFALWSVEPEVLDPPGTPGLIVGQRLDPIPCIAGSPILCMGPNQRFQARVSWTNPNTGETGVGHSLPLTADTGAFWFFGDQNLELMVKVLDGTAVNLRYWLYAGSLSNVDYTLTVTDTLTGVERTYYNPAGQFTSLADVTAFPFGLSAQTAEKTVAVAPPLRSAACGDLASLCLSSGQFMVDVSFTDPRTSLAGAARAVPLTGDTGAFWFFDDSNLELMVKVLDGRAVNGKFWVFYGALSDVDFRVTVTRLATGEARTYHNPRGTLASHADVQAF